MKSYHWIILVLSLALIAVSARLAFDINDEANHAPREFQDEHETMAINVIMTRTSVREYTTQRVPDSLITKVLRAGMAAPSAMNKQPWAFVVIEEPNLKSKIAKHLPNAKPVEGCSFAVVVCGNLNTSMESDNPTAGNWALDCSAATENMLIAAHALGIGSVWCGIYPKADREEEVRDLLSLPDSIVPLNVIAFGYPANPTMPKDKWEPSKVFDEEYGKPFFN